MKRQVQASHKPLSILVFLGLLVLLILVPNSPKFRPITSEDSGIFLYTGKEILKGKIPYRDVWDHKGPAIYYINALGLAIAGGSRWGVWFIEFLLLSASAYLGFILIKKVFGLAPAIFGSVLWIISLIMVLDGGNLTEEYALLLQFTALYLFYKSEKLGRYSWRGLLIGFTAALCFLLRPNLIGIQLSVVIFLLINRGRRKKSKELVESLGNIFLGATSVFSVTFLYFVRHGAIDELVDAFFRFNFVYSSSSFIAKAKSVFMGLWILSRSGITFVVLTAWIAGIIFFLRKTDRQDSLVIKDKRPLILISLIGLPVELLLASIAGKHSPHYYLAWLPIFGLLAGVFAYFLINSSRARLKFVNTFLFCYLIAMSLLPAGILAYQYIPEKDYRLCQDIGWFLFPSAHYFECKDTKYEVSEYITDHTAADDYVLMWGFGQSVNFYTERRSPTRFIYQSPLYKLGYQKAAMVEEFLRDIKYHKPALIIDTSAPFYHLPPIDKAEREEMFSESMLPEMDEVFEYIDSNYEIVTKLGQDQWPIYSRINSRI